MALKTKRLSSRPKALKMANKPKVKKKVELRELTRNFLPSLQRTKLRKMKTLSP